MVVKAKLEDTAETSPQIRLPVSFPLGYSSGQLKYAGQTLNCLVLGLCHTSSKINARDRWRANENAPKGWAHLLVQPTAKAQWERRLGKRFRSSFQYFQKSNECPQLGAKLEKERMIPATHTKKYYIWIVK